MTDKISSRGATDEGLKKAKEEFIAWFVREYPENCILARPVWHAPKIFNAAATFLDDHTPRPELASPVSEIAKPVWDGKLRIDSDTIINGVEVKAGTVLVFQLTPEKACYSYAAPQDVAGVKARCDIDAQHPAVAAPLSQSDKPEGLPFCRVCGSRENEPCPYHTLKSGCPHGVPMVYARSSVATNEGETPRTDAVVVQTRMEAAAEKYETSWGIAFIALRDHSRQLERELVALTRHFHEEREQYEARLYARSARGENDALDAKRYRFLRDGEPNATFITSRETRARYVADDDVDLDRYIDDALREYVPHVSSTKEK